MANPRILYESRLADATPAASSTAAGDFAAANLADWISWTFWKPAAMPATVTVDSGSVKSVDYWAVWGHDLNTRAATVELRSSSDNFAAVDDLVDSVAPADDKPFARYVTTPARRYWRMRFTGAGAPTLAIAALGVRLDLPEGLASGFDPIGRMPVGRLNRSVTGQPLSRAIDYEIWKQRLDFDLVTWTFIRDSWLPAWDAHLEGDPFLFVWDPAGHPTELRYVNQTGGFASPHRAGSRSGLKVDLEGLFP